MGGRPALPSLHDLEQVHRVPRRDRRGQEVVDDERLDGLVGVHVLVEAPVSRRTAAVQVVHDAGEAGVADREELPAGRVAERLSEEALAAPGLGYDHDDLVRLDPVAGREPREAVAVELSLLQVDDVLDTGGRQLEARLAHELGDLAVAPGRGLRLDQHLHALLEGVAVVGSVPGRLAELVAHGPHPEPR